MKLLLDTHTFLWLNDQPERLSEAAMKACSDPGNRLFLSIVSLWEIQIKQQLGKLALSIPWANMLQEQEQTNGLAILPIRIPHIQQLTKLPMHHRDPFDRLLLAQVQVEAMVFVSADQSIAPYGVNNVW